MKLIFPNAQRMNRGGYELGQLLDACRANGVTDFIKVTLRPSLRRPETVENGRQAALGGRGAEALSYGGAPGEVEGYWPPRCLSGV